MKLQEVLLEVHLSLQRALWGEVIPSLRAVAFEVGDDNIEIYFYHDGELNLTIEEHYACIETEASADFYYDHKLYSSESKVIRMDYPEKLPSRHDHWVYKRAEPFVDPNGTMQSLQYLLDVARFRLLGEVIPSLRGMAAEWKDNCVHLYYYHDGDVTDEIHEHYSCLSTEIIANFSKAILEEHIKGIRFPKPIPKHNHWVYKRKEPFVDPK